MRSRYFVPIGLLALVYGLVLGTGVALGQAAEDDPALLTEGQAVFEATCAGCHGVDGMGTERGRSLIDVAQQQPDRLVHVASVTNGKGFMPAFSDSLTADEIDAAVSYVRLSFVSEAAQSEVAEPAELAVTGASTSDLALVGVLFVTLGGIALAVAGRRDGAAAIGD